LPALLSGRYILRRESNALVPKKWFLVTLPQSPNFTGYKPSLMSSHPAVKTVYYTFDYPAVDNVSSVLLNVFDFFSVLVVVFM